MGHGAPAVAVAGNWPPDMHAALVAVNAELAWEAQLASPAVVVVGHTGGLTVVTSGDCGKYLSSYHPFSASYIWLVKHGNYL